MKYLQIYESLGRSVWVLNGTDIFDSPGSFSSYTKLFKTEKDCENYLINLCNELQDEIMSSNEYTDDTQENYKKYSLDDLGDCKKFLYELGQDFGEEFEQIETHIAIYEDVVETVQIKDEYKIKTDAKKYNL